MPAVTRVLRNATRMTAMLAAMTLIVSSQAQATVLKGYVEHSDESTALKSDKATSADAIKKAAADSMQAAIREAANVNSFPKAYSGNWHCVTTVTDSEVATIAVGEKTESDVEFHPAAAGNIVASWTQPGWIETQSSITRFSNTEARVDRTDYFFGDGGQGSWAARSRDQFTQIDKSTIVAKSYVDQYVDGRFTGRYRTNSVLTRSGSTTDIAAVK